MPASVKIPSVKQRSQRKVAGLIAALVVGLVPVVSRLGAQAQGGDECGRNPQLCVWRGIRRQLTGADSRSGWLAVKDVLLPGGFSGVQRFGGKLISASPETNPTELLLAVDGSKADAKIQLIEALPGSMPMGSEIQFAGTAIEFTKTPYMLTLESDTVEIEGWTGK